MSKTLRTTFLTEAEVSLFAATNGKKLSLTWGKKDEFTDTGSAVFVEGPVSIGGSQTYKDGVIFNYNPVPKPWGSTSEIITDAREEDGVVVGYGKCKIGLEGQPATLEGLKQLPKFRK